MCRWHRVAVTLLKQREKVLFVLYLRVSTLPDNVADNIYSSVTTDFSAVMEKNFGYSIYRKKRWKTLANSSSFLTVLPTTPFF